jgi:hypothetical protein
METLMPRRRVVACGVFRPALDHLGLAQRFPGLLIDFVESNLHLEPERLRRELAHRLRAADPEREEPVVCLFGRCAPDIDDLSRSCAACRPPGEHCYEMLLGRQRYAELMQETAGTYFLEQDLIRHFTARCVEPLELDDSELKEAYFRHYKRALYVRQPADPDLGPELAKISDLLELKVEIRDADYSELEGHLLELLRSQGRPKA